MRRPAVPTLLRWTACCAAAEAVGMTAAAGASKTAQGLADQPGWWGSATVALSLAVLGGLVEGAALGTAQGVLLGRWLPDLRVRRYLVVTVLVAGLGWAAGSVPATLSGDDTATAPPLGLVLLGAAGIGVVMGPLLGAAQAVVLRGAVPHPWRWVTANALAWPLTMCLIFLGASTPGSGWSVPVVLLVGAVTGALAGAALGLVTGWCLPSLDESSLHNGLVLHVLGSRRRLGLDRRLVGLAVRGRRSGRTFRFPVQYAADDAGLVVAPGRFEHKTWWRNVEARNTSIQLLVDGCWVPAGANLLRPAAVGHAEALATYRHRWPAMRLPAGQPLVRIQASG